MRVSRREAASRQLTLKSAENTPGSRFAVFHALYSLHTFTTRPMTGSDRSSLISEKDAIFDVITFRNKT